MFEKFPSLTRFSHGWTISEKLDGSNGQILIVDRRDPRLNDGGSGLGMAGDERYYATVLGFSGEFAILAGSRQRLLTLDSDNFGFARFVADNAEALIEKLGEGRHFGEWVGKGIQRGYGLKGKRFVLFNTHRWTGADLPDRVDVVPVLFEGYAQDPGKEAAEALAKMKEFGSAYAPGFMNPEGVVMCHGPSGTIFKKTFDYDEQGKWAENQARKGN